MVQTEGMTDLLTHHVEFLIRIVIGGSIEVGVIHLGRALSDVRTSGDVNRGEAKPAIIAIRTVAYLNSSSHHFAVSACCTSDGCEVHHGRITPISDRSIELSLPIGR